MPRQLNNIISPRRSPPKASSVVAAYQQRKREELIDAQPRGNLLEPRSNNCLGHWMLLMSCIWASPAFPVKARPLLSIMQLSPGHGCCCCCCPRLQGIPFSYWILGEDVEKWMLEHAHHKREGPLSNAASKKDMLSSVILQLKYIGEEESMGETSPTSPQ